VRAVCTIGCGTMVQYVRTLHLTECFVFLVVFGFAAVVARRGCSTVHQAPTNSTTTTALLKQPAMLLATALLTSAAASSAATSGLTLNVYDNTALAGVPVSTSVVDGASLSLPGSKYDGAWSAELVGSITFPSGSGGTYEFDCSFANTTMAFVWVDGHLVCQDGNAYQVAVEVSGLPPVP
jgi:hypothetical protein